MTSTKRALSIIAWLIVTHGIAWILLFSFSMLMMFLGISLPPGEAVPSYIIFALLGFFWIVSLAASKRLFLGGAGKKLHSGEGDWLPVAKIRDYVVKAPQFLGRIDRKRGLLEATARKPEYDDVSYEQAWSGVSKEYRILRLRAELLDDQGNIKDYIPVEIRADKKKWIGNLDAGDRFRVKGEFRDDGILHAKAAFNFSTNSMVGEK